MKNILLGTMFFIMAGGFVVGNGKSIASGNTTAMSIEDVAALGNETFFGANNIATSNQIAYTIENGHAII